MSIKKRLATVLVLVLLVLGVYVGGNILVDPFGVFGDPVLDWYSYNMTNNARAAKIAYLEKHNGQYDAYIVGSSSAASCDVAELNRYLDASFYNLFIDGSSTGEHRDLVAYVLENYQAKYIVLNLDINDAAVRDDDRQSVSERMHGRVTGESLVGFYARYAFCSPRYAIDKVVARLKDTELPQDFDAYVASTGAYDRRTVDVEKIGDMAVYEAAHSADFAVDPATGDLPYVEQCVASVAAIRDMCAEKGVELIVVVPPVCAEQWAVYDKAALSTYMTLLAGEVDYWDFSYTALSHDRRYFYDAAHFRGAVGTMMLADIFESEDVYRPENFGTYITEETCGKHLERLFTETPQVDVSAYTKNVPVLIYHHFAPDATEYDQVSPAAFERQLALLKEAGYTTVTFRELIDYVYYGGELPEKPVCITIDDGYYDNYEFAWPVLQRNNMKATIFPIGCSVGHMDYYKDTQHPITPHFGYEEAREMMASGAIDIQSHTYDMHQWPPFEEGDRIRSCMLPFDGESDADYAAALRADMELYGELVQAELGKEFCALAYPGGLYDTLVEVLVHEMGIPVTLSVRTDSRNVLVRGLPQSLYALCRWNVNEYTTAEELMGYLA